MQIQHFLNLILTATPETKIDFAVGGQAVIEGVMMRSPSSITIAVRKNDGSIKIRKKHYRTLTQKYSWLNVPIVRGVVNLFEMMIIGTEAINYSAAESLDEEPTPDAKRTALKRALELTMFVTSFVIAIGISLFLFKVLPLWITTFIDGKIPAVHDNFIIFNIIDGILKMLIFMAYISLLSLMKDFQRIFEYHGAEHKAIFNYEAGIALTPYNSQKQSRFHPRCGTSFILIVFVISIIVYTFVPKQDIFWHNLVLRIGFLPIIAGVSYEYLKYTAKYATGRFSRALVTPGLWFQRLTTREPNKEQLEVSIASLKAALEMEKK